MGNFPFRAAVRGAGEVAEPQETETASSGSSSSFSMLMAGALVAGTALMALCTWQFFSQPSPTVDAGEDRRRGAAALAGESSDRLESDGGGSGARRLLLEGLQMPPSRGHDILSSSLGTHQKSLKILSYNVWFEDVKLRRRMNTIGRLVQTHSPDLISFQEITPEIYNMFQSSRWWEDYNCSVPPEQAYKRKCFCMQLSKLPAKFSRKPIGLPNKERELCIAQVDAGDGRALAVATGHLVSPYRHAACPSLAYTVERVAQAKEALRILGNYPNAVFGGDMNWDEELDGPVVLPHGWFDAWERLRPGEDGWTYDTVANRMLQYHLPLQKRTDRFLCRLGDFAVRSIEMIGAEVIPGLYCYRRKMVLPVVPSDHFGLLLTIDAL